MGDRMISTGGGTGSDPLPWHCTFAKSNPNSLIPIAGWLKVVLWS